MQKINSRTAYVTATSKGFGGCAKHGKSIRYFYYYKGKRYDDKYCISSATYNRCKSNGYARRYTYLKPFEIEIRIDSLNPELSVLDPSTLCLVDRANLE